MLEIDEQLLISWLVSLQMVFSIFVYLVRYLSVYLCVCVCVLVPVAGSSEAQLNEWRHVASQPASRLLLLLLNPI